MDWAGTDAVRMLEPRACVTSAIAFSQQPPALSSLWRVQTLVTSATALTGHSSPCVRFSPVGPSAVPFAATPLPLIGPHRPQSPPSCPETTPLNLLSPLSAQAQGVDEPLTANPGTRMEEQEDPKANQWTRLLPPSRLSELFGAGKEGSKARFVQCQLGKKRQEQPDLSEGG